MNSSDNERRGAHAAAVPAALGLAVMLAVTSAPVFANGWMESRSWQFQTSADRANRAAIADLMERKKGGYYDSFNPTINNYNYTNIERQVNCDQGVSSIGNHGSNSLDAAVSSPQVDTHGQTTADATGNQASNSGGMPGWPAGWGDGRIDNGQSNSGSVDAGVSDSSTSVSSGPVHASNGNSDQALNSSQDNQGSQHASLNDSTACSGFTLN